MATLTFCCGGECGVSGPHWTAGAGSPTFSTSTKRNGDRALRANPSAAAQRWASVTGMFSGTVGVLRMYVNIASHPTSDAWVGGLNVSGLGCGLAYKSSDGKYYAASGDGTGACVFGATGITLSTATWYRIDIKVNVVANPWLIDVQVDGSALGQASKALAATTLTTASVWLGTDGSSETFDIYYDDICTSVTSADYPIGSGYVNHFVATSDGTHTATTTTIVKGTIAAPTGGGNVAGATDVFNWVNGVPLLGGATDNTRLVNQQTAGATLYAEVIFGPAPGISTPTAGPRCVEVATADREATTATCNFITKLNDNGTESDVINRGTVAGQITDRYARKAYAVAPTGGAWTATAGAGNFNNIRARFGYSSDATPDIYWRGIMIEAEFASGTTVDLADTSTATETQTVEGAASQADTSTASETLAASGSATVADTSTTTETITVQNTIVSADASTATETQSFAATETQADTSAATETLASSSAVSLVDSSTATETVGNSTNVTSADSSTATETRTTEASTSLADTSTATETRSAAGAATTADTSTTTETRAGAGALSLDQSSTATDVNSNDNPAGPTTSNSADTASTNESMTFEVSIGVNDSAASTEIRTLGADVVIPDAATGTDEFLGHVELAFVIDSALAVDLSSWVEAGGIDDAETIITIGPAGTQADLKDGRTIMVVSSGRTFINVE